MNITYTAWHYLNTILQKFANAYKKRRDFNRRNNLTRFSISDVLLIFTSVLNVMVIFVSNSHTKGVFARICDWVPSPLLHSPSPPPTPKKISPSHSPPPKKRYWPSKRIWLFHQCYVNIIIYVFLRHCSTTRNEWFQHRCFLLWNFIVLIFSGIHKISRLLFRFTASYEIYGICKSTGDTANQQVTHSYTGI